jgi:plasmid stabilization system protein ParE
MYRLKFLPAVAADRVAIREYLNQFYSNTAHNFFALLKSRLAQLKQFPFSCPTYEDDADYRIMTVGDYLVFYMVNERDKMVEVHRIFHHSRDILRQLNG